jgi:putative transposase
MRRWRLKCKVVADRLQEVGGRLFTFTRLPLSQWKSARTQKSDRPLHEEFKRRIKTQTALPSPRPRPWLFWALLAAGQITTRKVNDGGTLRPKLTDTPVDLAT